MNNERAAELFEKRVYMAEAEGAEILYHPGRDGALLPPIVIDKVPHSSELVMEETFGPIVPIVRVPDDDDAVIEILTQVKGIGVWTAQMFLMFSLGRLDIFPCDDLGIKNAIATHYQFDELPSKSKMLEISKPWRPYSTVASWYLWQSLDLSDD